MYSHSYSPTLYNNNFFKIEPNDLAFLEKLDGLVYYIARKKFWKTFSWFEIANKIVKVAFHNLKNLNL